MKDNYVSDLNFEDIIPSIKYIYTCTYNVQTGEIYRPNPYRYISSHLHVSFEKYSKY